MGASPVGAPDFLCKLNTIGQSNEIGKPKCKPAKRLYFGKDERRKRVRDDFLMRSIKSRRELAQSATMMCHVNTLDQLSNLKYETSIHGWQS